MDKFYVVINESEKNSWSDILWNEIKDDAIIYLDNNTIKNRFLKKIKKYHFSNKINKFFWIPFKFIWDKTYSIKYDEICEKDINYIIFQSNIKFSPNFIKKIKKEKNAYIILYLPDTVSGIGIGNKKKDIDRYKRYYNIDEIYSFDEEDCKKYDLKFFDLYSKIDSSCNNIPGNKIFYIGNCRNKNRLNTVVKIYENLKDYVECDFRLVGISDEEKKYADNIMYNSPLNYLEVIKNVFDSDILLEIMNDGQSGNTLRFKEAICYNKRIITNNKSVLHSKYYNKRYMYYFEKIEDIDKDWVLNKENVNYKYKGDFSPRKFLSIIKKEKEDKG